MRRYTGCFRGYAKKPESHMAAIAKDSRVTTSTTFFPVNDTIQISYIGE